MKGENNFLQRGCQLGAGSLAIMFTTTSVTPIMNFTNHIINGTKLQPKPTIMVDQILRRIILIINYRIHKIWYQVT